MCGLHDVACVERNDINKTLVYFSVVHVVYVRHKDHHEHCRPLSQQSQHIAVQGMLKPLKCISRFEEAGFRHRFQQAVTA